MIDANQRWDVGEAITWVTRLAEYKPLWIEEPTSPDDILGHAAISKVMREGSEAWVLNCFVIPHILFPRLLFNCIREGPSPWTFSPMCFEESRRWDVRNCGSIN